MGRLAVVAFVIVVGYNLPVASSVHFPGVVEFKVIPVDPVVPWKLVNALKIIRPGNLWLGFAIQADPDKTVLVNVGVYREETILAFVEMGQVLITRGFGKLAVETIGPAVIEASKDLGLALLLGDQRESSMPADIVESIDVALAVLTQHKLEACYVIA